MLTRHLELALDHDLDPRRLRRAPARAGTEVLCRLIGPLSERPGIYGTWDLVSTLATDATELASDAFFHITSQCLEGQVTTAVQDAVSGTAGRLYGASIIEPWTQSVLGRGERTLGVDIYWNVSTWNPYQVVLVRTRILRRQ